MNIANRLSASLLACATVIIGSSAIGTTAVNSNPGAAANVCVRDVGDRNGDGLIDYAVSRRNAAKPVVFLVYGDGQPPAIDDVQEGRQQASAVFRGSSAAPFLCSDAPEPRVAATARRARTRLASGQLADASAGNLPAYQVVDLDPLMPGFAEGFSSAASDINAHGQVVGRFFTPQGERAYLYSEGAVRDLGTLGGHMSAAYGINDAGDVVGYSLTGGVDESGFVGSAFLFNGYGLQDLGTGWSAARAINNVGQIVGEMRFVPGVDQLQAFLFDRGGPMNLGALPQSRPYSSATSVNAGGLIVGESTTVVPGVANPSVNHPATHAFIYDNGALRDLGTLGQSCTVSPWEGERCLDRSTATAVTNTGLVVGYSLTPSRNTHAFVSGGNGLIDLGTLDGAGDTWAYDANESGQVVGAARTASGRFVPFLYDAGVMYDLTTLIGDAGSAPLAAFAINDFGQIAADHHLLTPNYAVAAPGQPYSISTSVASDVTFEYWAAGFSPSACASGAVELQVRASGARPGRWRQAALITDCNANGQWRSVSLAVPAALRGRTARLDVRLVTPGPQPGAVTYLRRFRTR